MSIVQKGDPVLQKTAHDVDIKSLPNEKITAIVREMKAALAGEPDGVAIAAPQIGHSLRIFAVAEHAYPDDTKHRPTVFINPIITKLSKEREWVQEGCLSVRWWYGETHRATRATVEAYDEEGQKFSYGGSGLMAQIFQHETDHLDGILFDEHARSLRELTEEERPR